MDSFQFRNIQDPREWWVFNVCFIISNFFNFLNYTAAGLDRERERFADPIRRDVSTVQKGLTDNFSKYPATQALLNQLAKYNFTKDGNTYLNVLFDELRKQIIANAAMKPTTQNNRTDLGGIDLNSANLNLQIKRDGKGIPIAEVLAEFGLKPEDFPLDK